MEHVSRSDLDEAMAELWRGFADLARSRVADLERYSSALAAGQEPDGLRAAATSSAHKLAGALGSYRRAGSAEAGRLETLLRAPGLPDAGEVAVLVTALRAAVEA